ncbi:MAG: tRNA lysidine(34) synthetase TilS [Deltaproteobacteria bacterium]|nr:tRNA lysidine(34) synthetase TilS [Deltaproteobacteria bacterium]
MMPRSVGSDKHQEREKMRTPRFVRKVAAALDQLLPATRPLALGVAVSGGPDSVALLGALATLAEEDRLSLTVLHVNHHLRQEADDEQRLVERLAAQWQLPCVVATLTPPEKRSAIEAWARAERYRFFQMTCANLALHAVVLAHTVDDQAETVLFRLLRGSARRGLGGIPPRRALGEAWILRPLLDCARHEVMEYLHAQQLPYAVDPSNADWRYSRNKIRHRLLPLLAREFSPRVRHHLAALATTFREEEAWLDAQATAGRGRVQIAPTILSLSRFAAEPEALHTRILRQWLEENGLASDLTFFHLRALRALSRPSHRGSVDVPGNRRVRREGDALVIADRGKRVPPIPYNFLLLPGNELVVGEGAYRVVLSPLREWQGGFAQVRAETLWQAFFDGDAVRAGVFVRTCAPGDRVRPLGMHGHKKVHDVFVDTKVPAVHRATWPVVVVGADIAWVPGCVRGEVAKVTATTRWVCQGAVVPLPGKGKLC